MRPASRQAGKPRHGSTPPPGEVKRGGPVKHNTVWQAGRGLPMVKGMVESFSPDERSRFQKLLVLAKESPYPGERRAALAAAERLAARKGLSLEDAARFAAHDAEEAERRAEQERRSARTEQRQEDWFRRSQTDPSFARRFHGAFHAHDSQAAAANRARQQQRWAEEDAERRAAEEARQARSIRFSRRRSQRRMPPREHAKILILETGLPLGEIARVTGMPLNDVIALKLKLRPVMGAGARSQAG
jgi:hypothetical protein